MVGSSRTTLAACLLVAHALAPSAALAGPMMCDVEPDGRLVCVPPETCASRRDCLGPPGTEDWFCRVVGTATATPICVPSCGTIYACDPEMPPSGQCPALPGRTASCTGLDPAADLGADVPPLGLCTYSVATRPAAIDYCTEATAQILGPMFRACHTMPRVAGDPAHFTSDYFQGDCDGDGCANGRDAMPCTAGSSCLPTSAESPTCAPAPPLACRPGATGIECGDARPCQLDGAPCALGRCEASWSDGGPRCRPECSTLFLCSTMAASTVASGDEPACPRLGTEIGMCVLDPTMSMLVDDPRYDGICVYPSWRSDGTCDVSTVHTTCAIDADGLPTANFYTGDCDSDGIPNGCDSLVCDPMAGPGRCLDAPGDPSCRAMLPTLPDAAVPDDAGLDVDSGPSTQEDAASESLDADTVAIDAGPPVRFGGGGGCRCRATGTGAGGASWALLALLAMGLGARRARAIPR